MNSNGLSIELEQTDGRRHLKLSGELDLATVTSARAALSRAQAEGYDLVVDTTDVTFIDSTGLAALVSTRQRMGERFTLVAGPATRRLLELSGTVEHFGLEP